MFRYDVSYLIGCLALWTGSHGFVVTPPPTHRSLTCWSDTADSIPEEPEVPEAASSSPASPVESTTTPASPTIGSAAPCVIKVIGVGGGGGNAVNHMIQQTECGVTFCSINTDSQALSTTKASKSVNIGRRTTRGLGAGGDPSTGAQAALESVGDLENLCEGADMVFITAGMGGGTGSGAAPVLAQVAQDSGCLTVAVVTKPFAFEGRRRMMQAEDAIQHLQKHVDTMIVISNDKLLEIVPEDTPIQDAFLVADDVLRQGVIGISEIILRAGLVNVDFADVKAVMKDAGKALMGIGTGRGNGRASEAAIAALSSPLLDFPVANAQRVVFNIVGGTTLGLSEVNEASAVVYDNCDENANIIFGATIDPTMGEEVSVTVLACGFEDEYESITKNGKSTTVNTAPSPSVVSQPPPPRIQPTTSRAPRPSTGVKRGFTRPAQRPQKGSNEGNSIRRLFGKIKRKNG